MIFSTFIYGRVLVPAIIYFALSFRQFSLGIGDGCPYVHKLRNENSNSSSGNADKCEIILPNTTAITAQQTANLSVDYFFSLWIVFNNGQTNITISEKPYTILAPHNNADFIMKPNRIIGSPVTTRKILLDHIILGQKLDLNIKADLSFTTLGGKTVNIRRYNNILHANGVKILGDRVDIENGRLIIVENYLFTEELTTDHSFLQDMTEVLSLLQSGVRTFQHLLARTNVTKLLAEGEMYTVLVPMDEAFQQWHPIDYGFYPFSVPEFTESVLTNHFIRGNIRQDNVTDGQIYKTLGDKEITFKRTGTSITANGVEIIKGDTPVTKGNIIFIPEVLFMDHDTVEELRKKNPHKETGPLIHDQFLPLALYYVHDRCKQFGRFLQSTDLSEHIRGNGYTLFVPMDKVFEQAGLNWAPSSHFSGEKGKKFLLSHFVKGVLYTRDFMDGMILQTMANTTLRIQIKLDVISVENATISDKDGTNFGKLGALYFVDDFVTNDTEERDDTTASIPVQIDANASLIVATSMMPSMAPNSEVEVLPNELNEEIGKFPDMLF